MAWNDGLTTKKLFVDTALLTALFFGFVALLNRFWDFVELGSLSEYAWFMIIAEVFCAFVLLSTQSSGPSIGHSRENIAAKSMLDDPSQVMRNDMFNASRANSAGRLFVATLWPLTIIALEYFSEHFFR